MDFEQKRESARKNYEACTKYKDIAPKYNVSLNTTKRSQYK